MQDKRGRVMGKHSEAQWNAAISAAIRAEDVEAVPQLLVLMALDGYGHEAESLRRAMVAFIGESA